MMIRSKRLDLVPLTPSFLRASLEIDLNTAEQILGAQLPKTWPDSSNTLSLRLRQLQEDSSLQPWLLRAIVLRAEGIMVGHIGFHSAPGPENLAAYASNAAEFGFTVFPPFRRCGYAREASVALMDWAHQTHGVCDFVLSIRPDNVASQSLAAQLGFLKVGSHIDPVDGPEDVLQCTI